MSTYSSAGEAFLDAFHNAHPGLTATAFGALPVVFRETTFASSYDVLAATVPMATTPTRVLDLACGDGFLLALLAARRQPGLMLYGVDMSVAELQAARGRVPPDVTLHRSKAQALPFDDVTFDYVLCHLALMLMDDAEHVLREVRRVLKPSGTLAAVIGARPPPSAALAAYAEVLARHPPEGPLARVQLGDRRFRHLDGVEQLLSPVFRDILVEDISIRRRLKPTELWRWFANMYDLHLRSEPIWHVVERELLEALAAHCDADGRIEYAETLRYVSAVA